VTNDELLAHAYKSGSNLTRRVAQALIEENHIVQSLRQELINSEAKVDDLNQRIKKMNQAAFTGFLREVP
jgi:hypothetical protein